MYLKRGEDAQRSQNLLELFFLRRCEARGELDVDADDEVAPLGWLLRLGHAQIWVFFCPGRAGGAAAADVELLAVDCLDGSAPACEGFFEIELYDVFDVVAFAGEEWVVFLNTIVSFFFCNSMMLEY